jgi:mono/diheme cytochrome c family protein
MTSFRSLLVPTSVACVAITVASAQRPSPSDSARTAGTTASASPTARASACCDTTAVRAMRAGSDRLAALVDAMNAAPTSRKVAAMASVVVELVNRQREMESHMSGMLMGMAMTDSSTGTVTAESPSRVAAAPSARSAATVTPDASSPSVRRSSSPTAARAPSTAIAAAASEAFTDSTTAADISAGRKIFHGPGTCAVCHGQRMEGTPMAPTLAAHTWKDAKGGGFAAILGVINTGVPGTAMVSRPGGINSGDAQRVAAYVWAVSHGKAKP